jgi:vacuolar-type H+-ATPase subunit C/Vma6
VHTDLPYVCARLRARFPLFLGSAEWDRLRGVRSLPELLPDLLATDYAAEVRTAVFDARDLAAWETALRAVLVRRLTTVYRFLEESVPAYCHLVTDEWDLHHVRSLFRRVLSRRGAPGPGDSPLAEGKAEATEEEAEAAARVMDAYVPIGALSEQRYRLAAAAASADDLCTCLAEVFPKTIAGLRKLLEQRRDQSLGLPEVELEIENAHFRQLLVRARQAVSREDCRVLRRAGAQRIDATNLRTSLRYLGRHISRDVVHSLFVPGGLLVEERFAELMEADAVDQLYRRLPRGPLTAALEKGMLAYANVGRASVFERPLEEQQLRLEKRLARRHPASVALPLYFVGRVRNEWINLRMICRGIRYRLPAGKVQGSLVDV